MERYGGRFGGRWSTAATLILGLAALSGCGGRAAPPAISPAMQARADLEAKIGALIFSQDAATTRAGDVLVAKVGQNPPVHGWITRVDPEMATTLFVAADGSNQVVYRATGRPGEAPTLTQVDPPQPLDAEGAAMLRAETTARHAVRARCGDGYDPVVLPASLVGKEGWLVYLLAGSMRPNVHVMAGHHLVRISADGNDVLEDVPLSGSCIVFPAAPKPGEVVMLSRSIGDVPTAADYYTAMEYQTHLAVVFRDGTYWDVGAPELSAPAVGGH